MRQGRASTYGAISLVVGGAAMILGAVGAVAGDLQGGSLKDAPVSQGAWTAHLEGTAIAGGAGDGIVDGFSSSPAYQGSGTLISGYIGHSLGSNLDIRIGGSYGRLGAGATNGDGGYNDYGIDRDRLYTIDADIGMLAKLGDSEFHPFVGLQYLNVRQDQGFHPDAPFGCCYMNSSYSGIGPRIGFDVKAPIISRVSLVANASAAYIFGARSFDRGTGGQVPPASGSSSQDAISVSGFAGLDIALMPRLDLTVGYKIMDVKGATYSNQGFNDPNGPSGDAANVLRGPTVGLTAKF